MSIVFPHSYAKNRKNRQERENSFCNAKKFDKIRQMRYYFIDMQKSICC